MLNSFLIFLACPIKATKIKLHSLTERNLETKKSSEIRKKRLSERVYSKEDYYSIELSLSVKKPQPPGYTKKQSLVPPEKQNGLYIPTDHSCFSPTNEANTQSKVSTSDEIGKYIVQPFSYCKFRVSSKDATSTSTSK